MPDTPISSRRKRRELSRYGGLEKEISTATQSSFYTSTNNSRTADVHEGSVRDVIILECRRRHSFDHKFVYAFYEFRALSTLY